MSGKVPVMLAVAGLLLVATAVAATAANAASATCASPAPRALAQDHHLHYPNFTCWYCQAGAGTAASECSTAEVYPRKNRELRIADCELRKRYLAARIPALNAQTLSMTLTISTNGGVNFATTEPEVTLEGTCSPLRDVTVNGSTEGVCYPTATAWWYTSTLWTRDNVFVITDGLDSRTITVYWDNFHGGTLTEDTTLLTSGYPYVITDDIVVSSSITLTIEPSATLRFRAGRSLRVEGRLVAVGTPSRPVVLTRDGTDPWGGVTFQNSAADNRIAYATVEYAGAAGSNLFWQGITAYDSKLCVEHSTIRHLDGWRTGLYLEGSEAQVLDNVIHSVSKDGIHVVGGDVVVRGNHVYSAYEGIELEFMVTPAVLLDNHVHDIVDDCLDLDASLAVVERNELHHCGDRGISIGYPSSTTLVNNLVYASREGIVVEDGAVSRIVNNTVADNQLGIGLHKNHEKNGGFATLVNSIVWGNGTALEVRDESVVTVTYSDVEDGWHGEGNINAAPMFRAPQSGDYRLREGSPCVDAGTPVGVPDEDIRGDPRPFGRGYDQGAHEYREFFSYMPLVSYNYPPCPPLYHLYADPSDLAWLVKKENLYKNKTFPATFVYERSWDVDIRLRGDVSRLMPKKCWKVFFPGSDTFQGQGELNLNADYPDQTLLRSYIGYDLFARVGVPTPRAGHARLYINDEYYGLFSQVEQVDERFLYRRGIDIHGNLYKPFYGGLHTLDYIEDPAKRAWWYRYYYPKKTNRQSGIDDVVAFIELINYTSDEQFPDTIAEVLDVNEWLDWYAVNILISNFEMMEKNYYLYHDLSTDRWLILPWDVDIALGHNVGPGGGGYGHLLDEELSWDNPIDSGTQESKKVDGKWNALIDRMMDVPEFRLFHCRRLKELMADEFSPAEMFPPIDAAFSYIRPWAEADPHRWQPEGFQFSDGPDELKTYVTNRIQFLETEMITFCPNLEVPLTVNEFMADNDSTVADEVGDHDDWIEIHNGSSTLTWDLGGMYLTDVLSEPTKWHIPDDTLIPPGGVLLFWADGEEDEGPLHASFALSGTGGHIGLFDRDVFSNTAISVLTYTAQATDVSYGRMPDGGETWQFFATPTPGWPNCGRAPIVSGTTHAPTWPTGAAAVTVTTGITDEGAVTATLWYRAFTAGTQPPDYQAVPMTVAPKTGVGSSFVGTIPAQADGTWVEYYVEAEDEMGMVTVDRPGWPQGDYRYVVGWQRPPLYINELMALNTHTLEDEDGETDDWIEIYNAGPVDIDVGGMHLSDNIGSSTQFTIPAGIIVPASGTLILWADGDGEDGHLNFKLSGAGEYVGLFDSQAHYYAPIDAVYFDPQTPDVSWGRFPDGGSEWHAMGIPTPGGPNRLLPPRFSQVTRTPTWPGAGEGVTVTAVITAGSPIISTTLWYDAGSGFQPIPMSGSPPCGGELEGGCGPYTAHVPPQLEDTLVQYYLEAVDGVGQSTLHPAGAPTVTHHYLVGYAPPAVLINEFLADNASVNQDEAGEYDDWVELYNGGAVTVTLDGMYLTDDLSEPAKWQLPTGTTIPPGGYLLVWCDRDTGQGPLHADFKLNRDGEEIGLFDSEAHGLVPLDWIVFGPQQEDVSYGRRPDGADTWEFLDPPAPGASNR